MVTNKTENITMTLPYPVELPVFFKPMNREGDESDHWKAIADRDNPNHVYAIVTQGYKTQSHQDAIGKFEDALHKHREYKNFSTDTKLWNDGARMQRTYKFPEINLSVAKGDDMEATMLLYNSYDTSLRFCNLFGFFRFICTNGMIVGETLADYKMKHTSGLDVELAVNNVDKAIQTYNEQLTMLKFWKKVLLTPTSIQGAIEAMNFTKKAMETVMMLAETGSGRTFQEAVDLGKNMDKYMMFCILTQYITHQIKSTQSQIRMTNKLRNVMRDVK